MKKVLGLLFLLGGLRGPARAQVPPAPFTLDAYVRAALEASPEVRQARETAAASAEQWKSQLANAILPTLSLTASGTPWGHSALNGYRWNTWRMERQDMSVKTALNLNLFNGFRDYLGVRSARLGRLASDESLRAALQSRAYEALRAFYDLNLKRSLEEVTRQNIKAQEDQHRLTEDLYKNGMKSLSDLLKAETDWRSAQLRLASAEAETKSSLMRFNILLDREPFAEAAVRADLEPGSTELPLLSADVPRALEARPEMRRARREVERSQVGLDQALQSALPSFSINATLNRDDLGPGRPAHPNANYYVGLGLSLPVNFNVASQYFNYRAAAADKRRAEAALAAARRSVRDELHTAWIALERSYKAYWIALLKEELSDKNLGIVTDQYRQGSTDMITLAQAQTDLLNARVEKTQAINEAFIHRAQYRLAAGDPLW